MKKSLLSEEILYLFHTDANQKAFQATSGKEPTTCAEKPLLVDPASAQAFRAFIPTQQGQ
jgi:hypothetical protein